MPSPRFPERLARLRSAMDDAEPIDALFVSNLEHVRYLTGFTGSSGVLLVGPDRAHFFTDGRYALQSEAEVPGFARTIVPQSSFAEAIAEEATRASLQRIGFEAAYLTFDGWRTLASAVGYGVALEPMNGLVESVKAIKSDEEIEAIRTACRLADAGCAYLTEILGVGIAEREVAWRLEVFLRERGATRMGFDTIVGSGPNGANVHGRAGGRRLGESGGPELVLIDFGCEVGGYNADITRTFCVGGAPTEAQRAMYDAVHAAQQAAFEAIRPGVHGSRPDAIARERLAAYGPMPHNLGHGLGRLVHDQALVLSPRSNVTLAPGMVTTVEPGVYVEGFGGVRIEDDVLVTAHGAERLTSFTRELLCVG